MSTKVAGAGIITILILGLLGFSAYSWAKAEGLARRTLPESMPFTDGHNLTTGSSAEALLFLDAGCDSCWDAYRDFRTAAMAGPGNVSFAVVPFAAEDDSSAERIVLAIECATIDGRDTTAMRLIFEERITPTVPTEFARALGHRNVPDFVSCMEERRVEYALAANRQLARTRRNGGGTIVVRGPPDVEERVSAFLDQYIRD